MMVGADGIRPFRSPPISARRNGGTNGGLLKIPSSCVRIHSEEVTTNLATPKSQSTCHPVGIL
jgi:hypothetical protein